MGKKKTQARDGTRNLFITKIKVLSIRSGPFLGARQSCQCSFDLFNLLFLAYAIALVWGGSGLSFRVLNPII